MMMMGNAGVKPPAKKENTPDALPAV